MILWWLLQLLIPVLLALNIEEIKPGGSDFSEKLPHVHKHYKNSRCRSDCIKNFVNVTLSDADSCWKDSDCWMCWDFCEQKHTFLCHDELLCFPGCRVSCNHLLEKNFDSTISLNVSSIQHFSRTDNILQWTKVIPTVVYTIYTKKPQKRWRFSNQTSESEIDVSGLPASAQIFIIATDDKQIVEKGIWINLEVKTEEALVQPTTQRNIQPQPIHTPNMNKWVDEQLVEVTIGDVFSEKMVSPVRGGNNLHVQYTTPLTQQSYHHNQYLGEGQPGYYSNQNPHQNIPQQYHMTSDGLPHQPVHSQSYYQQSNGPREDIYQEAVSPGYNLDIPVNLPVQPHPYGQPVHRPPVQSYGNAQQYQPYDRLEERSVKPEIEPQYPLHVQEPYPNPYIEHGASQSNDLPKMSSYNSNPSHVFNQLYPNEKSGPSIDTDFEIVHPWNLRVLSQEQCPGDSVEVVVKWEPYLQRGRYLLIWSVDDNNKGHTSHAYLLRPEAKLKLSQNSIYTLRVEFHPRRSQNTHFTLPSLVSPEIIVDTRTSNSGDHIHIGVMDPTDPEEVVVAKYGTSEIIYITFGAVSTILFLVTIIASLLFFKQRQKKFEEAKDAFVQSMQQQAELANKPGHRPLGVAYSLPTNLNTNSYIPTADNMGPLPSPSPSVASNVLLAHHPFTPRMTITPPSLPTIPESPSSGVFFYFPQTAGIQAVSNGGSPSTVSTGISLASTTPNQDAMNISSQLEKGAEMGLVNTQSIPDGAKKGQKPPPLVLANSNQCPLSPGQQSPAISMQFFSTSA